MTRRTVTLVAFLLLIPALLEQRIDASIECAARYLPVRTQYTAGTGPRAGSAYGTVACANSKRYVNGFGGTWADFYNGGAAPGYPIACDSLSVRIFNGSYQWSSWQTAGYGQLATAILTSGNVLSSNFRTNSAYASLTWEVNWFQSSACPAN